MASPKVDIRPVPHSARFVAWCHEPGCKWVYTNVAKTDVHYQATHPRRKHRDELKAPRS